MQYHLLDDRWISVQQTSQLSPQRIRADQISDPAWITLQVPKADLKGALFQFLIGLLQTAFSPEDQDEWKDYWETPPSSGTLKEAFKPFHEAFYLNTTGKPAFMQDFDKFDGKDASIEWMLLSNVSENSIKLNTDHFVKRDQVKGISPYLAALVLFNFQTVGPAGGPGYRVGIRGGGPLTTLVLPPENSEFNTLWHKLWLNVLTKEEMEMLSGNSELTDNKYIFPWLDTTRTSEKKGMETLPEHANPLQMYWPMPNRIKLNWNNKDNLICDLSGEKSDAQVTHYTTKNYGVNYSGHWIHPLSAYDISPTKIPNSIKAQPGGLNYRHWLGLVSEDTKKHRQPAFIVRSYEEWRCDVINGMEEAQVWAFGYDMESAKVRCWYEAKMPVFHLSEAEQIFINEQIPMMLNAATDALKTLKQSLKQAWFNRPKDVKGDISFIDHSFWETTERDFYHTIRELIQQRSEENAKKKILDHWRKTLIQQATIIFDQYVLSSISEDKNLKSTIDARNELEKWLNHSKPMKLLKVA